MQNWFQFRFLCLFLLSMFETIIQFGSVESRWCKVWLTQTSSCPALALPPGNLPLGRKLDQWIFNRISSRLFSENQSMWTTSHFVIIIEFIWPEKCSISHVWSHHPEMPISFNPIQHPSDMKFFVYISPFWLWFIQLLIFKFKNINKWNCLFCSYWPS